MDKKQFKYIVEMKKENEKFISVYEGNANNCIIKNLEYETNYQLRICSSYKNIKSNYSNICNIKTDFIDSIILNKNEKRKEYINKIIEWSDLNQWNYYIEEQEMVWQVKIFMINAIIKVKQFVYF